jgi:hypothetical protein
MTNDAAQNCLIVACFFMTCAKLRMISAALIQETSTSSLNVVFMWVNHVDYLAGCHRSGANVVERQMGLLQS